MFKTRLLSGIVLVIAAIFLIVTFFNTSDFVYRYV